MDVIMSISTKHLLSADLVKNIDAIVSKNVLYQ